MRSLMSQPEVVEASPAFERLVRRCREAGAMAVIVDCRGNALWHDAGASPFFLRYALAATTDDKLERNALCEDIRKALADSKATCTRCETGLLRAVRPAQSLGGYVVLLAVASDWHVGEAVQRVASSSGLDAGWVDQSARSLPSFGDCELARYCELFVAGLEDAADLAAARRDTDLITQNLSDCYEELSLVYHISSGMQVDREPNDYFHDVCRDVGQVIEASAIGYVVQDSDGVLHAEVLGRITDASRLAQRFGQDLFEVLQERKQPMVIDDLAEHAKLGWMAAARNLMAAPLLRKGRLLGGLFALEKGRTDFDSVDLKLLNAIAESTAVYLENSMLFGDVQHLVMGLLHSLTAAVDAKDTYTCGHSERVAMLARKLAQEAGFSEKQCERVYMAGLLHDVGKIGVPDGILSKPGKLTDMEFARMKEHPAIGARILADIKQVQDLIPGVLHHHERYDGRGYPHKLEGEAIPQLGRLLCLADSFDAMTSTRSYSRARPVTDAVAEIRRTTGTQFDPKLAQVFCSIDPARLGEPLRQTGERFPPLREAS